MNWLLVWVHTLLRRDPLMVVDHDRQELAEAQARQHEQRTALEVLEREAETYRRRRNADRHC